MVSLVRTSNTREAIGCGFRQLAKPRNIGMLGEEGRRRDGEERDGGGKEEGYAILKMPTQAALTGGAGAEYQAPG